MKFGILASEFVERDVNKKKFSKARIDMVNTIARTCYRDVQYLQDIEMKTAKKHLVQYFPELGISHWDSLISVIKNTNCPRLGKLVKQEMEIVSKILQDPAILTFNQMDKNKQNGSGALMHGSNFVRSAKIGKIFKK